MWLARPDWAQSWGCTEISDCCRAAPSPVSISGVEDFGAPALDLYRQCTFCDKFFEEAKRLGPTHSSLEDGWVPSSQKHPVKSASRGHAMGLPARPSAHFAGPLVRLRRETRRAGDAAGRIAREYARQQAQMPP